MTLREQIEVYVNIEYNEPMDKAKWKVTENEDGTIHLKYTEQILNDSHVLSGETDIYNGSCALYQLIDDIKQKTFDLYHEVSDWRGVLEKFYEDKTMAHLPYEIHLDDIKKFLDKKIPSDDGIEIRET